MSAKHLILAVILGAVMIAAMTNEQKYQAPIDHKQFSQIFHKQLKSKDVYVSNIFTEIEKKVKAGASVSGVKEGIHNLNDQLVADQSNDDTVYKTKKAEIEHEITEQELELERLEKHKVFLQAKLAVIVEEETNINSLWEEDHESYERRYAEQLAMKSVLETIIDKVTGILLHDDTKGNVDNLFVQLKKIGKGNHVEALIELTKVLTTGDIHELLDKFVAFHSIVEETITIDQEKEKENRDLYENLTRQIGEIKPDAETKLDETLTQIADGEDNLEALEEDLDELIFKYEKRKDLRTNAKSSAEEAEKQMESNLDKLVSWENTVGSGADAEEGDDSEAPADEGDSSDS